MSDRSPEEELLSRQNRARTREALGPLARVNTLDAIAHRHAAGMAKGGYFDHRGLEARFKNTSWDRWAENIAFASVSIDTPTAVVEGWLDSHRHRKTVMGPFRYVGVARVVGNGKAYWVAEYAS